MGEFRKQQLEVRNIGEEWLKIANKLAPLQEESTQIMELFPKLQREIKEAVDECLENMNSFPIKQVELCILAKECGMKDKFVDAKATLQKFAAILQPIEKVTP